LLIAVHQRYRGRTILFLMVFVDVILIVTLISKVGLVLVELVVPF
jgi:hypothetical protein